MESTKDPQLFVVHVSANDCWEFFVVEVDESRVARLATVSAVIWQRERVR